MGKFIVSGGKPLFGEVEVSGSKNAALPIIFASLITHGVSEIHNLPEITDVMLALEIIEGFGAKITKHDGTVYIDTRELAYYLPAEDKVSRLRASTYLIGAGLGRFGRAELQSFGGCNFSRRPIDMHICAAEKFGAYADGKTLVADKMRSSDIFFEKKSVGATVNALIMAASVKGNSRIYGYAEEPHVIALIDYLKSAGAAIYKSNGAICISGGDLHGGKISVPGDMIEAGTFLAASLITGGRVTVRGLEISELDSFLSPLVTAGVELKSSRVMAELCGHPREAMSIVTSAYPGFPTDLQPIFSVIMARFMGGNIRETVWPGRFGYISELKKLGVIADTDSEMVRISPSKIKCGTMNATDLRGGAAGILAALSADGRSEILSGEMVLRGYERFDKKLRNLGAEIFYMRK